MALRINHNLSSLYTIKNVNTTGSRLQENYQRLSSGLRINKAADDAAGLGVSENLRAQTASAKVAIRNSNDGVSVVQTAEGAMGQIGSILSRMRELAVESASETLADPERAYLDTEFQALITEIDRLATVTEFNGTSLIAADTTINVQVGMDSGDTIALDIKDMTTGGTMAVSGDVLSAANASTALGVLDTAIAYVSSSRATLGAAQNRLSSAIENLTTYVENMTSAESQIRDVDFAEETADFNRNQTFQQAGIAVLAQANSSSQQVMQLLQ